MHFQGAVHGQIKCDAGKAPGSERGLPPSAIFSVSIQMALAHSIKPFTINTRKVARRDLDLSPILAAFASFLLQESAIAERRREQVDALATDRERKRLDLCKISRIGDPDLSQSAMGPILCGAPLGGKS
jgi:hypothetical protein